jgi:hypothetical protein
MVMAGKCLEAGAFCEKGTANGISLELGTSGWLWYGGGFLQYGFNGSCLT